MPFINLETNEYPLYEGDLEIEGWDRNEPVPSKYAVVYQDPIPEISITQVYTAEFPKLIDGVWRATWEVRDLTVEEISNIKPAENIYLNMIDPERQF